MKLGDIWNNRYIFTHANLHYYYWLYSDSYGSKYGVGAKFEDYKGRLII